MDKSILPNMPKFLRERRRVLGYSQEKMASIIGVSHMYYQRLEYEPMLIDVRLSTIKKIAKGLKMTSVEILLHAGYVDASEVAQYEMLPFLAELPFRVIVDQLKNLTSHERMVLQPIITSLIQNVTVAKQPTLQTEIEGMSSPLFDDIAHESDYMPDPLAYLDTTPTQHLQQHI